MDNNGKINKGIDLGTTNSAIAVMENGVPVIKKSNTQKDTIPSIVSITRKGIIHTGDTAANELANQVLRATKTWDGRTASTDIFKEFKRTMGTVEKFHSKNLKKDFTSQQALCRNHQGPCSQCGCLRWRLHRYLRACQV